jgi:hypothetical protein
MVWEVNWEAWNWDENGRILDIFWIPIKYTVEAETLEEALRLAEAQAPDELEKVKVRIPENFLASANSTPRILGLKGEDRNYHKIAKHMTVFGGQITEMPDYGSFE